MRPVRHEHPRGQLIKHTAPQHQQRPAQLLLLLRLPPKVHRPSRKHQRRLQVVRRRQEQTVAVRLIAKRTNRPRIATTRSTTLRTNIVNNSSCILSAGSQFTVGIIDTGGIAVTNNSLIVRNCRTDGSGPTSLVVAGNDRNRGEGSVVYYHCAGINSSVRSTGLIIIGNAPAAKAPISPALGAAPVSRKTAACSVTLCEIPLSNVAVNRPRPVFGVLRPVSSI